MKNESKALVIHHPDLLCRVPARPKLQFHWRWSNSAIRDKLLRIDDRGMGFVSRWVGNELSDVRQLFRGSISVACPSIDRRSDLIQRQNGGCDANGKRLLLWSAWRSADINRELHGWYDNGYGDHHSGGIRRGHNDCH